MLVVVYFLMKEFINNLQLLIYMNKLKKIIVYGAIASSPFISSNALYANDAPKDSLANNSEYVAKLEQHTLLNSFFDSYHQENKIDFYNLNEFDGNDSVVKVNRLEKKLNDDLDFFIESEKNKISAGFKINF